MDNPPIVDDKTRSAAPMDKRAIPQGYPYDPKALKPLARTLWSTSVALGHALAAYRQFSRVKSASISPDGKVGGFGYIQTVDKIRDRLHAACELLSSVQDTMDDEIRAPHWKPKLGDLDEDEAEDIDRLLEDAQRVMDDPAEEAEEALESLEDENDPTADDEEEETQSLPVKVATTDNPQNLGGPRVDNRSPGSATGPGPSFNQDEWSEDSWPIGPRENMSAASRLPGATGAPSVGQDFGLGWGARGQGFDYGAPTENGWGVEEKSSRLPQDVIKPPARSDLSANPEEGLDPHCSQLPDGRSRPARYDRGLMDTSDTQRDQNQPYQPKPSSPYDYQVNRRGK